MFKKTLPLLSVLALMGACSHYTAKKMHTPYPTFAKSWLDVIKTKPVKPSKKRFPASKNSIPGLEEFKVALMANPEFLTYPVGKEITTEDHTNFGTEIETVLSTTVYLKQNSSGHFEYLPEAGLLNNFRIYDDVSLEVGIEQLQTGGVIKEIKKISATEFKMIMPYEIPGELITCELAMDLKKSSVFSTNTCLKQNGQLVSSTKVLAVTDVDLKTYADKLKSVRAEIHSDTLRCDDASYDEDTCFDSITDEKEKDWSYILK